MSEPTTYKYNKQDLENIRSSLFFDFDYYCSHCSDLRGLDSALHYLVLGYKEGMDPSYFFSNEAYFEQNPDIRQAGVNPLAHFLAKGMAEVRFLNRQMADDYTFLHSSGQFDAVFYLETYLKDMGYPVPDPLWHFLVYGADNGNNPNPIFDITKFRYQNPMLPNGVNIFVYYLRHRDEDKLFYNKAQFREYEAILESKLFDDNFYTQKYDVPVDDPLFHYVTQGYKEDCDPSSSFSNKAYVQLNDDVDYTCISPLGHYCLYREKENRYKDQNDKIYQIVKNSTLFDRDFYMKSLPANVDPYQHYIRYGNNEGRDPSPFFHTREYQALNPDAFLQGVNALYHYETSGKIQNRETTFAVRIPGIFPKGAVELEGEGDYSASGTGRVAIVSSYEGAGVLPRRVQYYLKALQPLCDAIILVMDNPVLPEALDVIQTHCTHYICRRHQMYDFGSYKLGLEHVYATMKLEGLREIVLCNDSMYGPLDGFEAVFEQMDTRACDVWGLSLARTHWYESLQSFFLVVRRRAFMSDDFRRFFVGVQEETNRAFVVTRYELQLTQYLRDHGLTCSAYLEGGGPLGSIPTKRPLTLMRDYAFPLLKRKALFEDSVDDKWAVLDFVRERNAELYDIMVEEGCEAHLLEVRKDLAVNTSPYHVVKNSRLFDREYCLRNDLSADLEGIDPVEQYLNTSYKYGYDPSADFSSREYALMYPDAEVAKNNPLVHYECCGYIGRFTTLAEREARSRVIFPAEAVDVDLCLHELTSSAKNVAIFATFSKDGLIGEHVVYYLRHLKPCVDYILVVADNPLLPGEVEKLSDVADYTLAYRHGMADFGSYAHGVAKLRQLAKWSDLKELVFCNDSCVGPIESFEPMFTAMRAKSLDLWSVSKNTLSTENLQPYFLVCGQRVIQSQEFDRFMNSVIHEVSFWNVIVRYRISFSRHFFHSDYSYDVWVQLDDTQHPLENTYKALMLGMPIVKTNIFQGRYKLLKDYEQILNIIENRNPELYGIIESTLLSQAGDSTQHLPPKACDVASAYDVPIKGKKLCVHFYVQNTSMFAARPLFEKMLGSPKFTAVCVVIPDIRFGVNYEENTRAATYAELVQAYGEKSVLKSWDEATGAYLNLSDIPDMVCYSSSYYSTHTFHSVKYVSSKKRTMLVNYGFFRSQYDRTIYRRDAYAQFWKVFLETEYNLKEAQRYTINHGKNCEVVGYAKMDTLPAAMKKAKAEDASRPKTILIAPHHSLPGGFNKVMHLSNFMKYQDLYLCLPLRFPQCHFIFRPHPMLFELLAKHKFWGKVKLDAWVKKLTAHDNMELHQASDYFDVFARSDALINDCGSYLVEYFYTKKPQCYLLSDHDEERYVFADLGRECLRRVYKAYEAEHITTFIKNVVLNGHDVLKKERETFADNVLMRNYPHVCDRIIDILLSKTFKIEYEPNKVSDEQYETICFN